MRKQDYNSMFFSWCYYHCSYYSKYLTRFKKIMIFWTVNKKGIKNEKRKIRKNGKMKEGKRERQRKKK